MDANHYNKSFRIKTEKAIQIINLYENAHSDMAKLSLLLGTPRLPQPQQKQKKTIEQGKWQKMQLMQSELKFVSLAQEHTQHTGRSLLKLIFREFSGREVSFGVAAKNEPLSIEQCTHRVKGEKIYKLQLPHSGNKQLFITFHSPELSFFKFKYEFVSEEKEQPILERALSQQRKTFYILPKIDNKSLYAQSKSQRSQASLELKARLKSPRHGTLQEAVRGKLQSISRQKKRLLNAKQKKNGINIYQEKSRQLREVTRRCRGLLEQYQQFCSEYSKRSESTYRLTVMLVFLSKFITKAVTHLQDETQKLNCAAHLRSVLRAVAAKFMKINRNLNQISPDPKNRQLSTIRALVVMEGRSLHAHSRKKAAQIVMDCLWRVGVGAKVNKVLAKSTEYRIKIRSIQKYWQERNRALLASFLQYINHQIKDLLSKHAQFRPFYDAFYEKRVREALSWQYLRESSMKLKSICGSYTARLEQIEEMKQANAQIALFNQRALKKSQKQYLLIPHIPSYPVTRYFRDIAHLKSMTRTWFQIQWRKQEKNTQKDKQDKRKDNPTNN